MLMHFREGWLNTSSPTLAVREALDTLLDVVADLAPSDRNAELRYLWLVLPRGTIEDFGDFEELLECRACESYEEFVGEWRLRYPDELVWRRLIVEDSGRFRSVRVDKRFVVSADLAQDPPERDYLEDATVECCRMLAQIAEESIRLVYEGSYNRMVEISLPYRRRTGVVRRSAIWAAFPEDRERTRCGITDDEVRELASIIESGENDRRRIGRLARMTGNDFLRACALGYEACGHKLYGKDGERLGPRELYMRYADGRDEGLTGLGDGLHSGPGIDLGSEDAWDEWYSDESRIGGHPWEVCRGGNSTHVSLYVEHDREDRRLAKLTGRSDEIDSEEGKEGYYFGVAGESWTRSTESVRFFLALKKAGLPVVLADAEAMLMRYEGRDLVGIVPETVVPAYCSGMFPAECGRILDFMHVYDEDIDAYGDSIRWLPEEPAELVRYRRVRS